MAPPKLQRCANFHCSNSTWNPKPPQWRVANEDFFWPKSWALALLDGAALHKVCAACYNAKNELQKLDSVQAATRASGPRAPAPRTYHRNDGMHEFLKELSGEGSSVSIKHFDIKPPMSLICMLGAGLTISIEQDDSDLCVSAENATRPMKPASKRCKKDSPESTEEVIEQHESLTETANPMTPDPHAKRITPDSDAEDSDSDDDCSSCSSKSPDDNSESEEDEDTEPPPAKNKPKTAIAPRVRQFLADEGILIKNGQRRIEFVKENPEAAAHALKLVPKLYARILEAEGINDSFRHARELLEASRLPPLIDSFVDAINQETVPADHCVYDELYDIFRNM